LWIDEIHTFNESRYGLGDQIKYYKENPTNLHPPLFYVLTHIFYPFTKPERDLRIIPLIFGILTIPMFYLLSRLFSPYISLPCMASLAFMVYHIYFSQDGRMYSILLFFSMGSLYFFMKYLKTLKRKYLYLVPLFFAIQFHLSYSSTIFIVLSQILWFYGIREDQKRIDLPSVLALNGVTLLLCAPWIFFLVSNYKGQPFMDPLTDQDIGTLTGLMSNLLNDWAPKAPLIIASLVLLILFPFFSRNKKNALILLALLVFPVVGLYSYCVLLKVNQFITSRYFLSFLPLFLITLYLSVNTIEFRFERLKRYIRPKLLFLILFVGSNATMFPLYYQGEKQDFRGLVKYLNAQLKDGDRIVVGTFTYIPGILYYFNVYPNNRHYNIPYSWKVPGKEFEFRVPLVSEGRSFDICHSNIPYDRYVTERNRLWILVGKDTAKHVEKDFPCILKGYFDGSFAQFRRFPSDASMYLFLWDTRSTGEKGTGIRIN
jgi:hypothetical protein